MSVLLEPISIHSCPLGLHQSNDGIQLPLSSLIFVLLILIEGKSLFVVEENGLVIGPKMVDLLSSFGVIMARFNKA
jgi:hypothetical protein